MFMTGSAKIGRPMEKPFGREAGLEQGMVFAGSPENVAERIVNLLKRVRILCQGITTIAQSKDWAFLCPLGRTMGWDGFDSENDQARAGVPCG